MNKILLRSIRNILTMNGQQHRKNRISVTVADREGKTRSYSVVTYHFELTKMGEKSS